MASNLRVDTILPSTGTNVAIGTASGSVTFLGDTDISTNGDVTIGGKLGIGGTLTYEDVTNIDSVGVITARSGIRIAAGSTVGPISGIVTYYGDGSGLTNTGAITSIASDGANRVLTSDGDGTATAHSFVTIENNRLSVNRGSGSGAFPLIVRRTDASGIIAEFANSSGYGLLIGQNSATGEAYLRTGTGQPMVFTTNAGSGIANERLRITSSGAIGINETNPQRYLHITGNDGTTGATSGNSDTQLIIENAGGNGAMIEFMSSNNGAGRIMFTDSDASNQGKIQYFHSSDFFQVEVATSAQSTMALHVTKQNAASNVQSDMIAFDVGGSGRGKIVSASSGSGNPQFGAYSDRRLKTNFRNYTGGYDRIKSIPVKLYDEVLNDQTKSVFGDNVKTDVIGWIADEVQSVFPDAVMGTKDEVDSDGKPVYQSLTEGTFLPDAIQAIQKLIQKVETLEAEVAALKGS